MDMELSWNIISIKMCTFSICGVFHRIQWAGPRESVLQQPSVNHHLDLSIAHASRASLSRSKNMIE